MIQISKINVQYSNAEFLKKVFSCKKCGYELLMFGCENPQCENYQLTNLKKIIVKI